VIQKNRRTWIIFWIPVLQLLFSDTDQILVLSFVAFLIAATLIIVDRQRRDQIGVTSKYLLTMLGLRSSV